MALLNVTDAEGTVVSLMDAEGMVLLLCVKRVITRNETEVSSLVEQ